jgi:hypothetical protein
MCSQLLLRQCNPLLLICCTRAGRSRCYSSTAWLLCAYLFCNDVSSLCQSQAVATSQWVCIHLSDRAEQGLPLTCITLLLLHSWPSLLEAGRARRAVACIMRILSS